MTVKVTGFKELDRKLGALSGGLSDSVVRAALREGAQLIADEAARLAPVDTGNLRDSIAVTDDRDGDVYGRFGDGGVSVFVGPVGSAEGGDVEYAKYQEFGTRRHAAQPFMRPAVAAKRDEAAEVTAAALAKAIQDAAK